jgi:undecaprenyl-diphosphatase
MAHLAKEGKGGSTGWLADRCQVFSGRSLGRTPIVRHLANVTRGVQRHVSVADERLGLRLVAGLIGTFIGAAAFLLVLVLVQSGWPPLREVDVDMAADLNRLASRNPSLVSAFDTVSTVFDPNVFRVAVTLVAIWYLIRREVRHAVWLLVTVFGGAVLGYALKELVGRARPVVAEPVSTAPGLSFPSGHALGATIGCGLLLLVAMRYLARAGQIAASAAAVTVVLITALSRIGLGVHFVSDVAAGIVLGLAWLAVTTAAYLAWRRETGQPVATPKDVGAEERQPEPISSKE